MKKSFLPLLLCLPLLLISRARGAIAPVQHVQAGTTGGTSTSVTLSGVASGDLVVLIVAYNASGVINTLTDTNGTLQECQAWAQVNSAGIGTYYESSAAAGAHQFSIGTSVSGGIRLYAGEYSGQDPTGACYSASAMASGSSTSPSSASLTPAVGDLAIGAISHGSSTVTLSGWAPPLVQVDSFTGYGGSAWAADVVASTNAINAAATLSASTSWVSEIALFKAASGGSSCTHEGLRSNGTIAVPTAGSTTVWLKGGTFGTVDCAATQYYQPKNGAVFGVN